LKARKICYSAIQAARFVTHGEDNKDSLGPHHHLNCNFSHYHHRQERARRFLRHFEANGVKGTVVEWYERAVEKLSGLLLLHVTSNIYPTHYVRRFLTRHAYCHCGWGARCSGSVALFFHENKVKRGNTSDKVFGVSNHVLRKNTTVRYEFKGAGAPRQFVQVAGFRRFQRGVNEIMARIAGHGYEAELLTRNIVAKPEDEAAEDKAAMVVMQTKLATLEDIVEKFYNEVNSQWSDIERRKIGHVAWSPEISVDIEDRHYTEDIGTFEAEAVRFIQVLVQGQRHRLGYVSSHSSYSYLI
jgi:hypothetical protein